MVSLNTKNKIKYLLYEEVMILGWNLFNDKSINSLVCPIYLRRTTAAKTLVLDARLNTDSEFHIHKAIYYTSFQNLIFTTGRVNSSTSALNSALYTQIIYYRCSISSRMHTAWLSKVT